MPEMSARAVAAIRDRDAEVDAEHGDHAVWLAVSHGDVIKAILADALGMHLDAFQRIMVDPASLSVIRYTPQRAFVLTMNSPSGSLGHLGRKPARRSRTPAGDAVVGGGAGPETAVPSDHRLGSGHACRPPFRPARALRARDRRRAREPGRSSSRPAPAPRSPPSRWRSSRSQILGERVAELLDELISTDEARDHDPGDDPGGPDRQRAARPADRGGVPGRHDHAVLGRRRTSAW